MSNNENTPPVVLSVVTHIADKDETKKGDDCHDEVELQEYSNDGLECIDEDCCEDDECEHKYGLKCGHQFIRDLVDINPDRAQVIIYCTRCFFILSE